MATNAPTFDPLNASPQEEADMRRGYHDGRNDVPPPRVTSAAYDHGRRNGVSDRTGHVEPDQRDLARRFLEQQRGQHAGEAGKAT